jgi:hypothetical protein
MNKAPTRLAGIAALVLAVATSVTAAHAGTGKSALGKLPKDTSMVLTMNVDRVKKSPLFQDVLKLVQMNQEVSAALALLKAQTSFDITKDVHTVVVGLHSDFQTTEKVAIVVEGKFDAAKLLAFAKSTSSSVKEHKHRRVTYYSVDGDMCLAFLGGYLVAAPKSHITAVIDVHSGKAPSVKANKPFMQLYADADTSKDFWAVFLFPPDVRKQFKTQTGGYDLEGAAAAVDIQNGLATDLHLATTSLAAATALTSLVKIGVAAASSDPQAKAIGLGAALSRMTVSQSKANVDIGFSLTPAELATIRAMIKSFL